MDTQPDIKILNMGGKMLRVCAAIEPKDKDKLPGMVLALGFPGLLGKPWRVLEYRPVPCLDYPGRYHYFLACEEVTL